LGGKKRGPARFVKKKGQIMTLALSSCIIGEEPRKGHLDDEKDPASFLPCFWTFFCPDGPSGYDQ
jgi:hypothetical protein